MNYELKVPVFVAFSPQELISLRAKKCYAPSVSTEARCVKAHYESQGGALSECSTLALMPVSMVLLNNVFHLYRVVWLYLQKQCAITSDLLKSSGCYYVMIIIWIVVSQNRLHVKAIALS